MVIEDAWLVWHPDTSLTDVGQHARGFGHVEPDRRNMARAWTFFSQFDASRSPAPREDFHTGSTSIRTCRNPGFTDPSAAHFTSAFFVFCSSVVH